MRCPYAWLLCIFLAAPAYADRPACAVRNTEIKQQPYSDAASISTLNENASVNIVSRQGGWLSVTSEAGNGWVRLFSLRSDNAASKPGDRGSQNFSNAVGSKVTASINAIGLTADDLHNAQINQREFEKLQSYTVNKDKAERFASDAKLLARHLDYLPSDDNP